MGCELHPDAANIPAVGGNNLWICQACRTKITEKSIAGGEKKTRLFAMDRWKKALNPPHRTKQDPDTPQPKKVKGGESLKQDNGRNRKRKNKKKRGE